MFKNKFLIVVTIVFIVVMKIINTDISYANDENFREIDNLFLDLGFLEKDAPKQRRDKNLVEFFDIMSSSPGSKYVAGIAAYKMKFDQWDAYEDFMSGAMFGGIGELGGYPEDLREKTEFTREDLMRVAYSLLDVKPSEPGKQPVPYFWGGKYYNKGFDSSWFVPKKITAGGGYSKTGQIRPWGLDCSGFVTWVYSQLPDGQKMMAKGATTTGSRNQASMNKVISEAELLPGDLGFYLSGGGKHVGIFAGRSEEGIPMFIHAGGWELPSLPNYGCGRVIITYNKTNGVSKSYPNEINGQTYMTGASNFRYFRRVINFPGE